MKSTAQDEMTAYVEGVRAALSGLPEPIRLELLEDLPEHLAEVLAEGRGTLVERLGTPQAYASELLAAAGFIGGFPEPPAKSRTSALLSLRDNAVDFLRRADVRTGPVIGYARTSDFLMLLRPAWWVLRGYLVAMVLAHLLGDNGGNVGLLPRVGGSETVAVALLVGCVIVSIVFGHKRLTLSRWPRYALWSGTAVLVFFAMVGFVTADNDSRQPSYAEVSAYDNNPYSNVQDVYVYDRQGKLVDGARLFDQDGSPIQLGNPWCSDLNTGEVRQAHYANHIAYPHCPENAPPGPLPLDSFPPALSSAGPSPSSGPLSSAGPSPSSGSTPSPADSFRPSPSVAVPSSHPSASSSAGGPQVRPSPSR